MSKISKLMKRENFFDLIDEDQDFLPRNEAARVAVLKSREIVKKNNEFIHKIKTDSNIPSIYANENSDAEYFSEEDSYTFDLYKIKSRIGITDFIKDVFGM